MRQRGGVAAVDARAARAGASTGAEDELAEPEREALFADASRAVYQEAGRERLTPDGGAQALAQSVVAVERDEGHARMMVPGEGV